jgi:acetolactate synthase-1/2/3 large subunit
MDPLDATPLDTVEPVPEAEAAEEQVAEPADAESAAEAPSAEAADAGDMELADAPAADDVPMATDDAPMAADEGSAAGDAETPREDASPPLMAAPSTVAELIAATLRAAGVRLAFTVPGESFLPVLDALSAAGIRVVATRHEGAAAFAAEAYGQLTGRPAACLGTRIVGAANLAIGVHTATADSTPMFALAGDVRRSFRGREAFQEVDLVGTVGRLAKWAGRIDDPAEAEGVLEAAARAVAEGRPGPAFIAVPEDVLSMPIPAGTRVPAVRPHPPAPEPADVRTVLHALASAERPVIVAGAGVLRARSSNDLIRLAELLHVPVVSSWRRGDVVPNDHPLYLGMTGFGSPRVVRRRIESADLVVVIGCRLNEPTTSGYRWPRAGQAWIHVDLEPVTGPVGDTPAPTLAVTSDARAFIRAAVARLKDAVLLAAPLAVRDAGNIEDRAAWEAATVVDSGDWSGPGVHPGRIVADLRRLLPEDAILTTDAGGFAGWAARGFRFRRPGTLLGPTSGAMGYGFPAALAAALVHRERRVVALVGDGGMGMVLAELETAVREGAQVVALVFDNQQYGMIHAHQVRDGSPTTPGTDLGPIDFAAAARACGARGVRVETDAAFEPALRNALAASGPTVIQLALDRRWVSVDDNPVSGS